MISPVEEDYLRPSKESSIFAAICSITFITIGCIGNTITIFALLRSRKLRTATTAFVVSLACVDLCFCAVCLPLTASRYIHEEWILGDAMCKLFPFFFYGNVGASLLSMTAITLNRLVLIVFPHLYARIYQKKFVAMMIVFACSFSFLFLLPTLFGAWGKFGYSEDSYSCTILPSENGKSPKKILFICAFGIPVTVILLSYSCIFYKVHKTNKNLEAHRSVLNSSRREAWRKDELRLTKMMLVIVIVFLLCFLPLLLANILEKNIRIPFLHIMASVLAWMASCTNPFIYAILNRNYREAYVQLLRAIQNLRCCSCFTEQGSSNSPVISATKGVETKSSTGMLDTATAL